MIPGRFFCFSPGQVCDTIIKNIRQEVSVLDRVQIIWVARSYTGPSGAVKSHKHSYYHMFHVLAGRIRIAIADETRELEQGSCILVPKETLHSYENPGSETLEYAEIKFSCLSAALEDKLTAPGPLVCHEAVAGELVTRIVEEFVSQKAAADQAASHYLLALLYTLTEPIRSARETEFRYIDASSCKPTTKQVVQYLESHFAENFSLDALAEAVGRNKSYLCTLFLKETGTTILDCLNTIRVRHAAELITYSDHSLTDVSAMCGFASASHFSRIFLKYAGVTPGQCRKAYPDNILANPQSWSSSDKALQANRFIYNVLARKRISLDIPSADIMPE